MSEIQLNKKNILASTQGLVLKTITVNQYSGIVTENNRKIVKAGTVVEDANLGYCIMFNDADVTKGGRTCSVLYSGLFFGSALRTELTNTMREQMALHGLKDVEQSEGPTPPPVEDNYVTYDGLNKIAYGENAQNLIVY